MTTPIVPGSRELSQTIITQGHYVIGHITGDEDFSIQGRVEGDIAITKTLTIQNSGVVKANVSAKSVVVSGVLVGDIVATDCVELTKDCRMVGDIRSPRVVIADGARFRGRVAMREVEARSRPPAPRAESRTPLRTVPRPPPPPARPQMVQAVEPKKPMSKPLPPPPPQVSAVENNEGPRKKVVINIPQGNGDKSQTVAMLMRAAALYRDAGSNVRALQMLGQAQKLQEAEENQQLESDEGINE